MLLPLLIIKSEHRHQMGQPVDEMEAKVKAVLNVITSPAHVGTTFSILTGQIGLSDRVFRKKSSSFSSAYCVWLKIGKLNVSTEYPYHKVESILISWVCLGVKAFLSRSWFH